MTDSRDRRYVLGYRTRLLMLVRCLLRGMKARDAAHAAGVHSRTIRRFLASAEDAGFIIERRKGGVIKINPGKDL